MKLPALANSRAASTLKSADRTRLVLALGVAWYAVRVIAPRWQLGFDLGYPDSASYERVARLGPFDPSFWWTERPVGVPFAMWLSGHNLRVLFLMQTILYALALAHLCSVLLRVLPVRWLAWATSAAVVSIGVHPRFGIWHLEVLSESLSLTTSIFMISTWTLFVVEQRRRRLVVASAATIVWMSMRDSHIVFALVVASALAVCAIAMRRWPLRRTAAFVAAAIALFSMYVLAAQGISDRNLHPLINNVGERVLLDADLTETFVESGMPLDDALLERAGADSWADDQAFLLSPDLEEFRAWVEQDGRRALTTSFVVDAPFWIETTHEAFLGTLPLDFGEYDRRSTSERLPTRLFWFQGPRNGTQFSAWVAGAALAIAVLAVRRRRLALAGAVALAATAAETFVSATGDSVEVQRHLLGPIARASLILVVIAAFGIQALADRKRRPAAAARDSARADAQRSMSLSTAAAGAMGSIGVVGAWIALEHRSQDFDPQYMRTVVERAAEFGGAYYENGIHNKGPFEALVYDSVRLFTSYDTYWFGISAYVMLVSVVLGWAAWRVASALGAGTRLCAASAALVWLHFSLSDSDYAGVLYSRNITTGILAFAVATTMWNRPWHHPRRAAAAYVALFALLGLAVQTLLTSLFAAAVVGTFVCIRRASSTGLSHPIRTAAASSIAVIGSAPLWYALRGTFDEFWSNWWTYAGFMSSSTGRSLLEQFGLGFQKMFGYYQERPGILLVVVAFIYLLRRNWPQMSTAARTLHVLLLAWLAAGWVELVLSQRYSSHYFSIVAVPTALIAVATGTTLFSPSAGLRGIVRTETDRGAIESSAPPLKLSRLSSWLPIASAVALLAAQGTHLAWIAIEGAGSFRNTDHYVRARDARRSGTERTHQAVFDLASSPGDPLLAWTMYPWTYLDNRRVPATRFSWKSFLIGEIYLGSTSPRYVLDGTWNWFAEDLAESLPLIYARPVETALVPDTPFARVVARDFVTVYTDASLEIGWHRSLWAEATRQPGPPSSKAARSLPSQWSLDSGAALATAMPDAPAWSIPVESCQMLTSRLVRASTADPVGLHIRFAEPSQPHLDKALNIDFDRSWSEQIGEASGVGAPIEQSSTVLETASLRELEFTLILTDAAAAIMVDGKVVSAIVLDGLEGVTLEPLYGRTSVAVPSIGDLDSFAGC